MQKARMKITRITILALLSLFQVLSCKDHILSKDDFIGRWLAYDGAELEFTRSNEFVGKNLPAKYFSFSNKPNSGTRARIDGRGGWEIVRKDGSDKIALTFNNVDGAETLGYYFVNIAGKKGILDNEPPWYIFLWEGEEGEKRYGFEKQR